MKFLGAPEANAMQDVMMYTTPFCGFCYMAKRLLARKGVTFTEVNVMLVPALREEMVSRSGRRTVPQIFIGETHVGGFDELEGLEQAGRLDSLLEAAP